MASPASIADLQNLLTIHNGTQVPHTFSEREYQDRQRRLRQSMAANQVDAVVSLNCFSQISGCYTAIERTLFFDHCDDASLRLWQVNVEVREAGLEFREDIETVLTPGMVVSIEPMIMIPDGLPGAGGYREHDILVVTATGAKDITGFPYGPEHNIIRR